MKEKLKFLIVVVVLLNIIFYMVAYSLLQLTLSDVGFVLIVSFTIIEIILSILAYILIDIIKRKK